MYEDSAMEASSGGRFPDRRSAGAALAQAVRKLHPQEPIVVLGLPRGGVPVAFEVARELRAPLDVLVVRKIGMPGQPELAIGAIAAGDVEVKEPEYAAHLAPYGIRFSELAHAEHAELRRREQRYRRDAPPLDLTGRTALLVDDGLATGATMVAAVRAARKAGAARVIAAAPVASREATALLEGECDELILIKKPAFLFSIGEWYDDFSQVDDEEVLALLEMAASKTGRGSGCVKGAAVRD